MVRKYLMIGGASFILGAGAMAYIDQTATAQTERPSRQTYRMQTLFGDVLQMTREQYVTPVDDKKLVEAAMEGMLASLDPHSGYLDPQELADMRDTTRGAYGGLGLEVTSEEGAVKVHRVVCAIDCGLAVNPDSLKAQLESAIAFGLGATLQSEGLPSFDSDTRLPEAAERDVLAHLGC